MIDQKVRKHLGFQCFGNKYCESDDSCV